MSIEEEQMESTEIYASSGSVMHCTLLPHLITMGCSCFPMKTFLKIISWKSHTILCFIGSKTGNYPEIKCRFFSLCHHYNSGLANGLVADEKRTGYAAMFSKTLLCSSFTSMKSNHFGCVCHL